MATVELPPLALLHAPGWADYELLDTGDGAKLERFGRYTFVRPEPQAIWRRAQPERDWRAAHGTFTSKSPDDDSGGWALRAPVEPRWEMKYGPLSFWAQATAFRHMGVFPEQAAHWDWAADLIRRAGRPTRVLNLFGYTGLFSLATAAAGAAVTHVDASKRVIGWGRDNQTLSQLNDRPIRWLLDDAVKFVRREVRRGSKYDGLMIDPPKFGRGPEGEVWKLDESLPDLLHQCRLLLSERPLFVILSCYAIRASALSLYNGLTEMVAGLGGLTACGETVGVDGGGRGLSLALFARWRT
jgi:23S rRNA (cytosine1962-C5)-methyltransferase